MQYNILKLFNFKSLAYIWFCLGRRGSAVQICAPRPIKSITLQSIIGNANFPVAGASCGFKAPF